jgi:hypothetical protein
VDLKSLELSETITSHVALFNTGLQFFLCFDYCHAIKNARNIFLDLDMTSSDAIISANYLKILLDIQENLIISDRTQYFPKFINDIQITLAGQI